MQIYCEKDQGPVNDPFKKTTNDKGSKIRIPEQN